MKKKGFYFGTNTKMSMTDSEAVAFLTALAAQSEAFRGRDLQLFVIPSHTVLHRAGQILRGTDILLGAQNMCWEERGQFTGEISPLSLLENGVRIAEIGHSERRHILRETDEDESKKVRAACKHGMTALLCIGETQEEKTLGIAKETLRKQLRIGVSKSEKELCARSLWIAYEPVWAIGVNGVPAAPEYVRLQHGIIRETLKEIFGEEPGENIPVLYGGSVNFDNALSLIRLPDVDGLFVGRSAWTAENYCKLAQLLLNADKEQEDCHASYCDRL